MKLNEAIETLNYIVKENPGKKTGLYTACDIVANHICNIMPVDEKITADYDFSATYKVVEVEEKYYNGPFPIEETNLYLVQIEKILIFDMIEEEEYYKTKTSYVSSRKKDRIRIYNDYIPDRDFKTAMRFAKDVSHGLLDAIADCK